MGNAFCLSHKCFNPRTYIRYDKPYASFRLSLCGFNPRTYIRYDTY